MQDVELEKLRNEVNLAGISYVLSSLNSSNDRLKREADFQDLKLEYLQEEARVKREQGIEELEYICPVCRDIAYLENDLICNCIWPELRRRLDPRLNFLPPEGCELSNFSTEIFSDESSEHWYKAKLSPRMAARRIKQFIANYVADFPQVNHLYIYGQAGTGKSHLLATLGNEVLKLGHQVAFLTADRYFDILDQKKFLELNFSPDPERLDLNRRHRELLADAKLLIIDDLGIESTSEDHYRFLLQLLDSSQKGVRRIAFASNLDPNEIQDHYGERVASRLVNQFQNLQLMGPDLRGMV